MAIAYVGGGDISVRLTVETPCLGQAFLYAVSVMSSKYQNLKRENVISVHYKISQAHCTWLSERIGTLSNHYVMCTCLVRKKQINLRFLKGNTLAAREQQRRTPA
jgi:hypothetical protein